MTVLEEKASRKSKNRSSEVKKKKEIHLKVKMCVKQKGMKVIKWRKK